MVVNYNDFIQADFRTLRSIANDLRRQAMNLGESLIIRVERDSFYDIANRGLSLNNLRGSQVLSNLADQIILMPDNLFLKNRYGQADEMPKMRPPKPKLLSRYDILRKQLAAH
jgi:hypothetical protein